MDSVNTNAGMTPADIAAIMKNSSGDTKGGLLFLLVLFLFAFMRGGWNGPMATPNIPNPNPSIVDSTVQRGFDQTATMGALGNIRQDMANNQMANMGGMSNLAMAIKDTNSDLKFTVANENCNDRQAINNNANMIMGAITNSSQKILDKMCQMEIDNLKAQNVDLMNKLNTANLIAAQTAQSAYLVNNNQQQTQYIVNRVAPVPVPAYVVTSPYATPSTSGDATTRTTVTG